MKKKLQFVLDQRNRVAVVAVSRDVAVIPGEGIPIHPKRRKNPEVDAVKGGNEE